MGIGAVPLVRCCRGETEQRAERFATVEYRLAADRHRSAVEQDRCLVGADAEHLVRTLPQRGLVGRPDEPVRGGVGDHRAPVDEDERSLRPSPGLEKALQEDPITEMCVVDQPLLDLASSPPHERQHERTRVVGPAGEVHGAQHSTTVRIGDRGGGARHGGQGVGEVLGAVHERRASLRERGTDGVGADQFLCVHEAGSEGDAVQAGVQSRIGDAPVEHVGPIVGEHDAEPRRGDVVGELVEDRACGSDQQRVEVDVGLVGDVEALGSESGPRRALPRGGDLLADHAAASRSPSRHWRGRRATHSPDHHGSWRTFPAIGGQPFNGSRTLHVLVSWRPRCAEVWSRPSPTGRRGRPRRSSSTAAATRSSPSATARRSRGRSPGPGCSSRGGVHRDPRRGGRRARRGDARARVARVRP